MDHFRLTVSVLLVAVTTTQAYPTQHSQAPALAHFMDLSPDGQYAFGYRATDASRQERRHANGRVEGSYSYKDPDGKLVNVSYGADSNGFHASGEHLPPQDTAEVKAAKDRFMATYAREVARINRKSGGAVESVRVSHPEGDDSVVVVSGEEPAIGKPSAANISNEVVSYNYFTNEEAKFTHKHDTGFTDQYWFYEPDMTPFYAHFLPAAPGFLIPLPVSAFRRVTAFGEPQVPKFQPKSFLGHPSPPQAYAGWRGGRKF